MAAVAQSAVVSDDRQFNHHSSAPADQDSDLRRDVKELVELLSKLNPSAKEFFPSSLSPGATRTAVSYGGRKSNGVLSADAPIFVAASEQLSNNPKDSSSDGSANSFKKKRYIYGQGKRRVNEKVRRAQREERIRRTVYVSEIDQHVTEEALAALFVNCGSVVDCRVCGDPHSVLRFAFIEFADEFAAKEALNLSGTMLGYYPLRVLPSKTAILPVNPTYLPQSEDEKEMCSRTVYCTNIDKKVTQTDVKVFFESFCGAVSRLRLLGDHVHSTRIAFVEFVMAESAINALSCSGVQLGALPIRVSPSKTPVRPRIPHALSL